MENAKMKLLRELQQENILAPSELDEAAAGSCCQMADDSQFLNELLRGRPDRPDRYDAAKCFASDGDIQRELAAAWASVGIEAVLDHRREKNFSNRYLLNGVPITRSEARDHAQKVVGKGAV